MKGDRADKKQIDELIGDDPDLARQIRNTNAICGHACAIERSLEFQAEYRASSNPEAVVAKYSDLFEEKTPVAVALRFGGSSLEILADGKPWLSASHAPILTSSPRRETAG